MKKQKQPKSPCVHVVELMELLVDNQLGLYAHDDGSANLRCGKCKKWYMIYKSSLEDDYYWEVAT